MNAQARSTVPRSSQLLLRILSPSMHYDPRLCAVRCLVLCCFVLCCVAKAHAGPNDGLLGIWRIRPYSNYECMFIPKADIVAIDCDMANDVLLVSTFPAGAMSLQPQYRLGQWPLAYRAENGVPIISQTEHSNVLWVSPVAIGTTVFSYNPDDDTVLVSYESERDARHCYGIVMERLAVIQPCVESMQQAAMARIQHEEARRREEADARRNASRQERAARAQADNSDNSPSRGMNSGAQSHAGPTSVTFWNRTGTSVFVFLQMVQAGGTADCRYYRSHGMLADGGSTDFIISNGYIGLFLFRTCSKPCNADCADWGPIRKDLSLTVVGGHDAQIVHDLW